jgi:hypothetical protein
VHALDRWASPVTRHLSGTDKPLAINDPRVRTIDTAIANLNANPTALE